MNTQLAPADESESHSDYSDNSEEQDETAVTGIRKRILPPRPSPEPIEASLESAIDEAPAIEVRNLLKELVKTQSTTRDVVSQRLLVPIAGSESLKRKAFEHCILCEKEYRVVDNTEGSCSYHTGKLGMSSDGDGLLIRPQERKSPMSPIVMRIGSFQTLKIPGCRNSSTGRAVMDLVIRPDAPSRGIQLLCLEVSACVCRARISL